MIKAVIFDMDGIIIDSEMSYLVRQLEFAQKKNPDVVLEDLLGMVGASREDAWGCMARAIHNGQSWEELRKDFHQSCDIYAGMDYRAIFRPEIREILKQLHALGLRLALASSTQMSIIKRVLNENEISQWFPVVVSGSQFKRSKPDPEIYQFTASRLGLKESECLAIEDSTFGITAASRAGMKIAALIDNRFQFDQSLADYRMERLDEILKIVQELL